VGVACRSSARAVRRTGRTVGGATRRDLRLWHTAGMTVISRPHAAEDAPC